MVARDNVSVAFVLAEAGAIGTVVVASPSQKTVRVQFSGGGQKDLEAAIKGVLLAIKPTESVVDGSTAVLLVSQSGPAELAAEIARVADACQNQAQSFGCSVDIRVTPRFRGYQHGEEHPGLAVWSSACSAAGLDVKRCISESGSAANFIEAQGLSALSIGVGTGSRDAAAVETNGPSPQLVELLLALPQLVASG